MKIYSHRLIYLFGIIASFISGSVLARTTDSVNIDSLVSQAVLNSETSIYAGKFKEAERFVDASNFENMEGYGPLHKMQLTIQEIRVNEFMNRLNARSTNYLENLKRLKELSPYSKEVRHQNTKGKYFLSLSQNYNAMGLLDSASVYEKKAISIFNGINDFEEIARIRAGIISRLHSKLLEAGKKQEIIELIPRYEEEIEYSKRYSKYALAYNTRHLAQIHRRQTLDFSEALRLFRISLDLRLEIGFKPFLPPSYSSLGDVYMKMGKNDEALDMYTRSVELAEEIGFVRYQVYPNIQMGDFYRNNGNPNKALNYYTKAQRLSENNDYSNGVVESTERIRMISGKDLNENENLRLLYVGNMGVLIEHDNKTVLIDGLHKEYKPAYAFPTNGMIDSLLYAKYPGFTSIELNLISHYHQDHFDPDLTLRFMSENNSSLTIGPEQAKKEIAVSKGSSKESLARVKVTPSDHRVRTYEFQGIVVNSIDCYHTYQEKHKGVQNIAHLVDINGYKILHVGDADWKMAAEALDQLNLKELNIDVALLPIWMLNDESSKKMVKEKINPKNVIASHIDPRSGHEVVNRLNYRFPNSTGLVELNEIIEIKKK
ncbi:tetratricopeptide repeat protein [Lutimonas zeaxanthinifaciens]|uniref:tetratricopeptide repeat protein n=1 Tax=Lutimonas zeaxanthinifaciens TaxID=3060215 RepID=UPI00265CE18E|nr:tetratricopeptide repeat protein [Lutimonas sp. YSD2104]WKK67129.1 tetratricopeptide repeat protein [Lutimonas sp. YSD2104]